VLRQYVDELMRLGGGIVDYKNTSHRRCLESVA
jgi:hypothetical protein